MRPFIHALLVVVTLLPASGCTGRARRPAIIGGGALLAAGTAGIVASARSDCHHSDGLDFGTICGTVNGAALVTSVFLAAIGTSLLVGSILRDEPHAEPLPPLPPPPPSSPSPPASDPASPMEPQPAAW